MLASYDPEEVVALLSCFVFQEKTDVEPVIPPKLEEGREAILQIADKVGAVQDRHKVAAADVDKKLKFGLVEVVYEWAKGMVRLRLFEVLPAFGLLMRISLAFRADHWLDGRCGGDNRARYHAAGRNVPRGAGRSAGHW